MVNQRDLGKRDCALSTNLSVVSDPDLSFARLETACVDRTSGVMVFARTSVK